MEYTRVILKFAGVAIVGVSGAVGQEFLRVLDERGFPVDELVLFGSSRSAGRVYVYPSSVRIVKLSGLKQNVLSVWMKPAKPFPMPKALSR